LLFEGGEKLAERLLKCPICGQYGHKRDMIREDDKRYYHIEYCHDKWKRDKEFKQKEKEELDSLVNTIVRLHKLQSVATFPRTFYPFIQELRNDSVLFGKIERRYKEGLTYKTIEDTYLYCSEKIEWARGNKEFKNIMSELKYCFAIVKNNIENYFKDGKKLSKQKAETTLLTNHVETMRDVNTVIIAAQSKALQNIENKIDITSLFD
jgi:hypothetical protein